MKLLKKFMKVIYNIWYNILLDKTIEETLETIVINLKGIKGEILEIVMDYLNHKVILYILIFIFLFFIYIVLFWKIKKRRNKWCYKWRLSNTCR